MDTASHKTDYKEAMYRFAYSSGKYTSVVFSVFGSQL